MSAMKVVQSLDMQDRAILLVMGWIRLCIENQLDNIPIEIKIVCKDFFGAIIDSNVLTTTEENMLLKLMQEQVLIKSNWNWELIYRGTEDGFGKEDFYEHCEDKANTVVIIHNEYNQVFGGYTPLPWRYNKGDATKYEADESLLTFLFILRANENTNVGPYVFKLRDEKQNKALSYRDNTAFDFGCNDLHLYQSRIYTITKCCFECDDENSNGWHEIDAMDGSEPKEIEIFQLS